MKNSYIIKRFLKLNLKDSLTFASLSLLQMVFLISNSLLNIFLPKYLIDFSLEGQVDKALWIIFFIALNNGIFHLLNKYFDIRIKNESASLSHKAENKLSGKLMTIGFENLEDPEILDLKEKATFSISNQGVIQVFFMGLKDISQALALIVSTALILFSLSPLLLVGLILISLINLLILMRFNKYLLVFFGKLLPVNRRFNYYLSTNFEPETQEDIRFFNMNKIMSYKLKNYVYETYLYLDEFMGENGRVQGKQTVITSLQSALTYAVVGIKIIVDKALSLGSISIYINAAKSFSDNFNLIFLYYSEFIQQVNYLEPFIELMDLDEDKSIGSKLEIDSIESLEFKGVYFAYPKADNYTLRNVSFKIEKGEKISLVGRNGAGKTTIVKLISKLYRPDRGEILINGYNIDEIDEKSYNEKVTAIFQDFKMFPFSIGENIASSSEIDGPKVKEALREVGILEDIEGLSYGLDTIIGKSYDEKKAKDFSGGQMQKMAIARAIYKDSDLIILDEPTAALDPLSEAEIYENFNQLVGGKMAFYISHRMSSSKFVDRIIVLDRGEIVEEGNHKSLVKKKEGIYYSLYNAQAEYYR